MRKFLFSILAISILIGCSPRILPPVETNTTVRDSLVIRYQDCVRVIPVERVVDIVRQYDTLFLETSIAKAKSYIDTTTYVLKGEIENKNEFVQKIVYKDRIEFRDSLVYKEVPVEIEVEKPIKYVPWWAKVLSIVGGISLAVAAGFVVSKFV